MHILKIIPFLCLGGVLQSGFVQAAQDGPDLAQLMGDSELVFQGTVQDIQYKSSVEGIPHTFVTYKIEDVISGQYDTSALTLRFVGGFKQRGDKVIRLSVSHSPQFAKGQQGVLMVRGNGSEACPLAGCALGSFQFDSNGYVVDGSGGLMALDAKGDVRRVPNLTKQREANTSQDYGPNPAVEEARPDAVPMDRNSFVSKLRSLSQGKKSLASAKAKRVVSADLAKAFKGPQVDVAEPPANDKDSALSSKGQQAGSGSDFDRWEEQELRKNGGNPVLKNKYPGKTSN